MPVTRAPELREARGGRRPYDFLGFAHIRAKRKHGGSLLKRRIAANRTRMKLRDIRVSAQRRHPALREVAAPRGTGAFMSPGALYIVLEQAARAGRSSTVG